MAGSCSSNHIPVEPIDSGKIKDRQSTTKNFKDIVKNSILAQFPIILQNKQKGYKLD